MRRGRRDANHAEVREALRAIPGVSVADTGDVGDGFFDLVVGVAGSNYGIEVKDGNKPPSARKLTPAEQKFHDSWQGHKAIVNNVEEAVELILLIIKEKNDA